MGPGVSRHRVCGIPQGLDQAVYGQLLLESAAESAAMGWR
jgi:hypothetical protein